MIPFIGLFRTTRDSHSLRAAFRSSAGRSYFADPQPLAPVSARPDRFPPPFVLEVPGRGLAQPAVEAFLRLPTQLAADPRDIHRISPVMSRPVGNKSDQPFMRPVRRTRQHFVEQSADRAGDIEIGPFRIAADII